MAHVEWNQTVNPAPAAGGGAPVNITQQAAQQAAMLTALAQSVHQIAQANTDPRPLKKAASKKNKKVPPTFTHTLFTLQRLTSSCFVCTLCWSGGKENNHSSSSWRSGST